MNKTQITAAKKRNQCMPKKEKELQEQEKDEFYKKDQSKYIRQIDYKRNATSI